MRIPAPLGRLVLSAACSAAMFVVVGPSSATAQSRSAAIKVLATVRGITEADMLGAHALAAPESAEDAVGAAAAGDSWRITSGRSSSVGLQVEAADAAVGDAATPSMTICEDLDEDPEDCRSHQAPLLRTSTDGALPEFVVRVGRRTSVRVTVAFLAY